MSRSDVDPQSFFAVRVDLPQIKVGPVEGVAEAVNDDLHGHPAARGDVDAVVVVVLGAEPEAFVLEAVLGEQARGVLDRVVGFIPAVVHEIRERREGRGAFLFGNNVRGRGAASEGEGPQRRGPEKARKH